MNVSCETDDNCPLKKVCSKEGKCISIREAHVNDPPEWCQNKICKVQTLKGEDWMGHGKTDDPCRRMITEENCNKSWVQIDKKHNTLNNIDMGKECYWNKGFKMCETPQVGPKPINELCTQDACDYKSLSPIDGCMDEKAGNFDPFATETINSKCDYYGCMMKETSKGNVSINYDEKATKDPGDMCTIIGCMDKSAANYDPDATTEYVKGHPRAECQEMLYEFGESNDVEVVGGEVEGFGNLRSLTFTGCINNKEDNKLYGPELSDCKDVYNRKWINNPDYFNIKIRGFQTWTVPITGVWKLEAWGGNGGTNMKNKIIAGGEGAHVKAGIELVMGEKLTLIVGIDGDGDVKHSYCGSGEGVLHG